MSEIRVICPGCGAEYRLPPDAIPATGREVECSACGHVWAATATGAPAPARLELGDYAAPAAPLLPQAGNRLAPSVLDILREEVEHERRQREAEGFAPAIAPEARNSDWPATTISAIPAPTGAARAMIGAPAPQPNPQVDHGTIAHPPAPDEPHVIRHPAPPLGARPKQGRAGYRTGFGLAVMLAAACVALYLMAPTLAQTGGPLGQQLLELRLEVDRGRLWLQDQARELAG